MSTQWQDYIDNIRERTDFVALIEQLGVELPHAPNGNQAVRAKRNPFRDETTCSLAVYEDHAYDFGGGGKSYDVFDVARHLWNCSFIEAADRLARQIGLKPPTRHLTPDEQKHADQQRSAYDLLKLAADFYASRLAGPEGQTVRDYAYSRGFDDETIQREGLGASGGLLPFLTATTINISDAVRVGLLARTEHGQVYEAIPPGYLVYVHRLGGKVRFLAGRMSDAQAKPELKARNIRNNGFTPKIPYFNSAYTNHAERVVIVEGQADAITLGAWGIPSVALCGSSMSDRLVERMQHHKLTYICLDDDSTGKIATASVAGALGPLTQVMSLHSHDVNQFAQAGGTADEFQTAMKDATTWMDVCIDRVSVLTGLERDSALPDLFTMMLKLDAWSLTRYKRTVNERLKMTFGDIKRYLEMAQETEADDTIITGARYAVKDGHLCRWTPGGLESLCNFSAEVVEEVIEDDGQDITRNLTILGTLATGKPLPPAYVKAADFTAMSWVIDRWGIHANIFAGIRTREHLRSAIQTLSGEAVKQRWVYTHTGWRDIDGELVYLTHASAIGKENVEISLTRSELRMYQLPTEPGDIGDAIRLSLSFLDVGPRRVTWPLLAAMYLAPLSSIKEPDFILWLYGTTGSLKSSITSLAMNHYGPEFDYNRLTASWEDTVTTLEKKAFTVKDAPLVIDDFAPQNTTGGANELEKAASRVLRNLANRTSRGRMRSDMSDRQSYDPRGLIICTGEQLPSGHSIVGRLMGIEMQRDAISLDAPCYKRRRDLCRAMTAYIMWLRPQMATLAETIVQQHRQAFNQANKEASTHLRVPSAVASLYIGARMFIEFAHAHAVIDDQQVETMRQEAWSTLLAVGRAQSSLVQEEDPSDRFLSVLRALLAQGAAYLKNRDGEECVPPGASAKMIGWQDADYLYLIPEVTYNLVASFCRNEGGVFPLKERALYKKLIEDEIVIRSGREKSTTPLRIGSNLQRVLVIVKSRMNDER